MMPNRLALTIVAALATSLCGHNAAQAQTTLACRPFTREAVAAPAPREARWPLQRLAEINAAVKTEPYRVLFLGDSITERFPTDAPEVWRRNMVPRGVLDAGVSGDRTEHLLWRLQHGNLAGPPPAGAIVLIGTNDLTNGGSPRSPEMIADGVRANLLYLREHLPNTRILLLGLWPRGALPDGRLRRGTVAVNELIQRCGDDRMIVYADIGGLLLDPVGRLPRAVSPDLLHFSPLGYTRLTPRLDALIDRLLAGR
jgi:lysophospholipase L1-like esterase